MQKALFVLAAILLLSKASFAEGLLAELAPEYYFQGITCERSGMLFEAKVFYQKALLLDPAIIDAGLIREKIAKINSTLGFAGSAEDTELIQPPSTRRDISGEIPARQYTADEARAVQQPSVRADITEAPKDEIIQQREPANEGIPAKQYPIKASYPDQALSKEIEIVAAPKPTATPQSKPPEFLTYYNGSEPFLQDCHTPLCQKIVFNNFGISYATEGIFPSARGMFEECLKIDSFFKPASYNLSLLDSLEKKMDR